MTTWEEHSVKASLDRSKSVEAGVSTGALSTGIVFVIFGLFGMYTVSNTVSIKPREAHKIITAEGRGCGKVVCGHEP
jgi:hypothetical protein